MSIRTIFFPVLLFASFSCFAQMPAAASWKASVEPADTCKVIFTATLQPGWHLYALELPEGGPRPTEIDLSGSRGVKFTGNPVADREAAVVEDDMFGMTLAWWDSSVNFSVPFIITDPTDALIEARISYMVCNGESCLPPRTETLSISLINQK